MKQRYNKALAQEVPFFMIMPALVWQVLFFFIPLLSIVGMSFLKNCGVTGEHYRVLLNSTYLGIIARSLFFAFLNACICLICAYPVVYFLARSVKRWKSLLLFSIMLPFWTNILVQIYAWFFVLERNGLLNTLLLKLGIISHPLHFMNGVGSIIVVMAYCYLPFMILPLYTTLEKLDERLIESSRDLGATSWQTFMYVTLPLSWSGIRTGFFLVLVPSFGEFVIPALMGGSKYMFVGSLISHYFLTVFDAPMGAAFTCFSGVILMVLALVLYRYFRKKVYGIRG